MGSTQVPKTAACAYGGKLLKVLPSMEVAGGLCEVVCYSHGGRLSFAQGMLLALRKTLSLLMPICWHAWLSLSWKWQVH
eukprot:1147581-Pelagomonas_calceolata.AAC.7